MKSERLRPREMETNRPELPAFLTLASTKLPVLSCFACGCFVFRSALLMSSSDFTTVGGRLNVKGRVGGGDLYT